MEGALSGAIDGRAGVAGAELSEGWLAVAGLAGITVTSLCYALAPPAAVLPVHSLDMAAALAGAVAGRPTMQLAGSVGVVSDIAATMGILVLVVRLVGRGRTLAAAGWAGVLLSILVFTVVDTMVGFVLPRLAAAGAREAFIGAKVLFDALFLSGTLAFGLGAIAVGVSAWLAPEYGRGLAAAAMLVGVAACAASVGCVAGAPVALAVGGSIGAGGLVFTWTTVALTLSFQERRVNGSLVGQAYQVAFTLYSVDGKRVAEVRESDNGETYVAETEWVEGTTFRNRHSGRVVGPFASPEAAEKFIVATTWFCGGDE